MKQLLPGESRVLYLDLSTGKQDVEEYSSEFTRKFVGGYGLAAKLLWDKQKPKVDPLGPDNMLGFFCGTCSGTKALVVSRYSVVGKSPLTGGWGDANSGGYFGPEIKKNGYDGMFFSGAADKPVYVVIDNGKASIKDASELWGKDTYETDDALKEIYGSKSQVSCIGPSSEKLSLISGISTDKGRFAARSGLGAVMGSKKLKAIVLVNGHYEVPIADPVKIMEITKANRPKDTEFTKYGTAKEPSGYTESGEAPAKNWGGAGPVVFPGADKITGDQIIKYQKKKYTCSKCPIVCGGIMEILDGPFKTGADTHKPQYESLGSLGIMCLIDDPECMIKFNEVCNRSGLDTISAGGAVAFAIECYENGILTKDDTYGLELNWGAAEAAVALTEKIGNREPGLGDLLADGVKRAAQKIGKGSEKYAIHIGGQEIAMHDPKNTNGLALAYLLDPTPGRHSVGGELLTPPDFKVDSHEKGVYTGRAKSHQKLVNIYHVSTAYGNCMLAYFFIKSAQSFHQFIAASTGWDFDLEEAMEAGERIQLLRHAFGLREGINPLEWQKDLSPRIFGDEPLTEGPNAGITVDYKTMINEYLEYADWDKNTTIPSKIKLEKLGLTEVAEYFHS